VAGIGRMSYGKFLAFDIIGGLCWVSIFVFGGYFFGNIPFVKKNFTIVILAIILISMLPGVFEYVRHRRKSRRS
jgi:membrane-associated protein